MTTTEEEKREFADMLEYFETQYIPRCIDEYKCKYYCNEFMNFVRENHCMPNYKNDKELYDWYMRQKYHYKNIPEGDFRKVYLDGLFVFLVKCRMDDINK